MFLVSHKLGSCLLKPPPLLISVQGGLTAMDVLAVEWIQTGLIHFGTTVSYFGFLSDGKI